MELTFDEELWLYVRRNYKTQAEAARAFNIGSSYLSLVMNGKRQLNKDILDALGYEKKITFVKKCL